MSQNQVIFSVKRNSYIILDKLESLEVGPNQISGQDGGEFQIFI